MRVLLLFVALLILSGCNVTPAYRSNIDWTNSVEIRDKVRVEYDDYEKQIHFKGPKYYSYREASVFLRSWRGYKSDHQLYQIYITDPYNAKFWRFYDKAFGLNTGELDLTLISRDAKQCSISDCSFQEEVAINVTRDFLTHHIKGGFNFKLKGNNAEELFHVPGPYIEGFLMNIDSLVQRVDEELDSFSIALKKVEEVTGKESEAYRKLNHEYNEALKRKELRF